MGRGLGFGMKPGKEIPEGKIEKVFRLDSQNLSLIHISTRILLPERAISSIRICMTAIRFQALKASPNGWKPWTTSTLSLIHI